MQAWWWFPISAVVSGAAIGLGKAAASWFIAALQRSLEVTVAEIVTPIVAELRQWSENAIVHRLDDHEARIAALEDHDG